VEIALARGDLGAARTAADELSAIAAARRATVLEATAAEVRGAVRLAEGDAQAAGTELREAVARWQELSVPYGGARARVGLALACRTLGDDETAAMDLEAARTVFARLGATPDLRHVERLSAGGGPGADGVLTVRELEVLAHVADGSTNRQIADALVISPHTVRRHLQNIFRKLGVSSRAAATAYALRHELVPGERVVRTGH
jgi:DNA-binding CsgD family transcriptional regulator